MMGKQNAAVLPEPVCAHAIKSLPARDAGMAYFCTGVGFLNLHLFTFAFTLDPRSRSSKEEIGAGTSRPLVSTGISSYKSKSKPVFSPVKIFVASESGSFRAAARSSASCSANGLSSRLNLERPVSQPPPPPNPRSSLRPNDVPL